MRKLGIAATAICLLVAAGQTLATAAAAAGSRSAVDTVAELEAAGHHVQLNGSANVPLSLCQATAVHGLNNSNIDSAGQRIDEDLFSTVYVDVVCQTAN